MTFLKRFELSILPFKYGLSWYSLQRSICKYKPIMRQVDGPNDHPTTPTFLHLYKILLIYSVLKPPKKRNCTITKANVPKVSLADVREIFHDKISEKFEKIR